MLAQNGHHLLSGSQVLTKPWQLWLFLATRHFHIYFLFYATSEENLKRVHTAAISRFNTFILLAYFQQPTSLAGPKKLFRLSSWALRNTYVLLASHSMLVSEEDTKLQAVLPAFGNGKKSLQRCYYDNQLDFWTACFSAKSEEKKHPI